MYYWFGLPSDQTPTGPVTFTIINRDGSSTSTGGVDLDQVHHYLNFGDQQVLLILA